MDENKVWELAVSIPLRKFPRQISVQSPDRSSACFHSTKEVSKGLPAAPEQVPTPSFHSTKEVSKGASGSARAGTHPEFPFH